MKKNCKLIASLIMLAVLTGGLWLFNSNSSEDAQGRLRLVRNNNCNIILSNFAPGENTTVKFGKDVDFQWNGPGCSKYPWTQYDLCFKNRHAQQEFACIGVIPNSNHWTLDQDDWRFINEQIVTRPSSSKVDLFWYVQSIFGNHEKGEILTTNPWSFSYTME